MFIGFSNLSESPYGHPESLCDLMGYVVSNKYIKEQCNVAGCAGASPEGRDPVESPAGIHIWITCEGEIV